MVDLITWNSLTEEDRREFDALRIQVVNAVIGASARDKGIDAKFRLSNATAGEQSRNRISRAPQIRISCTVESLGVRLLLSRRRILRLT
jgi:hypothetical protein